MKETKSSVPDGSVVEEYLKDPDAFRIKRLNDSIKLAESIIEENRNMVKQLLLIFRACFALGTFFFISAVFLPGTYLLFRNDSPEVLLAVLFLVLLLSAGAWILSGKIRKPEQHNSETFHRRKYRRTKGRKRVDQGCLF